jgi:TATA-binding protein-associated factor Taf7
VIVCGFEVSRATAIAMLRADAADRAEQRAREQAAEERQEEIVARARQYFHEHGEWEWQTREREQDMLARAEARAEEHPQAERDKPQQERYAQLIASGQQPRTVAEILAVAALYP